MLCLPATPWRQPSKNVLHFLSYFPWTYNIHTDSEYLHMMEISCRSAPHHELLQFSQLVPHHFPENQSQSHGIPNNYMPTKLRQNMRCSKLMSNMRGKSLLWWKAQTVSGKISSHKENAVQQLKRNTKTVILLFQMVYWDLTWILKAIWNTKILYPSWTSHHKLCNGYS